jgi:hypothetical protein
VTIPQILAFLFSLAFSGLLIVTLTRVIFDPSLLTDLTFVGRYAAALTLSVFFVYLARIMDEL